MSEKELINRIRSISWMSNCGDRTLLDTVKIEYVKDLKEFEKKINSLKWENAVLEMVNNMSEKLDEIDEKYGDEWNDVLEIYKSGILINIREKIIIDLNGYEGDRECIITDIMANICMILLANHFEDIYHDDFWDELLQIYESGHIACGYKKGCFMVY